MKEYFKYITISLAIMSMAVGLISLQACNTFKYHKLEGQPIECSDWATMLDWSRQSQGLFSKDNAIAGASIPLITIAYNKCSEKREDINRKNVQDKCIKIIYGPKLLPMEENYRKFGEYIKCVDQIIKKK